MKIFNSLEDPGVLRLFSQGAVGIIPTDTIYGLAALAADKNAVSRLYELKQRYDAVKSGTVIAADADQLIKLGVKDSIVHEVAHFWPNPLSIELPIGDDLSHLFQEGKHRAFRVVADTQVRELLDKTGPLLTSSANPHGATPAATVEEAQKYFGDSVDFYVDGGDRSNRPHSTVARYANGKLTVLRPGAVIIE